MENDNVGTLKKNQEDAAVLSSATGVIFRCGWCGYPVAGDGSFLPQIKDTTDAHKYLKMNRILPTKNVNGFCCPNGGVEI